MGSPCRSGRPPDVLIVLLAYLGGLLTILSPCILPVLPFVFARAGQSFRRSGLPMLAGMAVSFAAIASLAAYGGGWAVSANQYGRWAALLLLALFGLALLFPAVSDRLTQPLVKLGARLASRADHRGSESIAGSALLGVATGLLWAPCAGPILGLIFTTAAIQGAGTGTTLLLFAYAAGAATSLALALFVGGRLYTRMKKLLPAGEWIRRGLGLAVIAGVLAIAFGLDTRVLARLSSTQTSRIESGLAEALGLGGRSESEAVERNGQLVLPVTGRLPSLDELGTWINSPPLTAAGLKGKVVLIDFWTYSCINCIRSIPYVRAWHERYADDGLVIIGVHAPEFAFERDPANVRTAVRDLDIRYPVALDNRYKVWAALQNRYWPAHYFFDARGRLRYHHFGEGKYEMSERVIRQLLAEAGRAPKDPMAAAVARGAEVGAAAGSPRSPETYLGYARGDRFVSPGGFRNDRSASYAARPLSLDQWSLEGNWTVGRQSARLNRAPGKLRYRFQARDLHLVLRSASGKPIPFRMTIDGRAPGVDAGVDVNAKGEGVIGKERLYQLVRQKGGSGERLFEIEFLAPGSEAFAFTFG